MDTERPDDFNAIHSYFIGPKGANLPDFRTNINTILDELLEARQNYYPDDRVCTSLPSLPAIQHVLIKPSALSPRKFGARRSS